MPAGFFASFPSGGGGSSGANTALSNLTTTAINVDLTFANSAQITAPTQLQLNGGTSDASQIYVFDSEIDIYTGQAGNGTASVFASVLALQDDSGAGTPSIQLFNQGNSHSVNIRALAALATDYTITLPPDAGSNGQALLTDGAGILAWGSVTPTGTPSRVAIFDAGGALSTDNDFQYFGATNSLSMGANVDVSGAAAGVLALGHAQGGSTITGLGIGSIAGGFGDSSSAISVNGNGSIAFGNVGGSGSLTVAANAVLAGGFSVASLPISATGDGALLWGGGVQSSAQFSQAFGLGTVVSSYAAMAIGTFADCTGTPTSSVPTDPVFCIGNGTGYGSTSNCLKILKNGTQYIKDTTLGAASVGYVRTLLNATTGETGWAAAAAGGSVFADNVFRIQDDGDATKQIAFQANGITTGTTRTITMADSNINLSAAAGGTYANAALSNISSTAVNANINPDITNTRNLGSGGFQYALCAALRASSTFASEFMTSGYLAGLGIGVTGMGIGSISAPANPFYVTTSDDTVNNSTATQALTIRTGDKTAGTGNSGDINLSVGTSAGGTRGHISMSALYLGLPTGSADPTAPAGSIYYNTGSNTIRWYNGTTWASLL